MAEVVLDAVDDSCRDAGNRRGQGSHQNAQHMPQITTAGPDCHKMPSTGGTFLSAWTRSRHALREDCGLASVMKFRFLWADQTLRRLGN